MLTALFLTVGWVPMSLSVALASMAITVLSGLGPALLLSLRLPRLVVPVGAVIATCLGLLWCLLVLKFRPALLGFGIAGWATWIGATVVSLWPIPMALSGVGRDDAPATLLLAKAYHVANTLVFIGFFALVFAPPLRRLWL